VNWAPGRARHGGDRTPATILRATPADVSALTQTLARASFEDPLSAWICPSDALRTVMLECMYRVRLRQMVDQQWVWTTPERSSAALWAAPGQWSTTLREDAARARCVLHPRVLARSPLLALGLNAIHRRHPRTPPHWYLSLLGTDPDVQGLGLGSAVLGPALERCDSDGVGAYLETSKERNLDFYARHGFGTIGELRLPRGPKMWFMWRDPRPRR
jgi:GNAT superfamily N-acetyltransferase